MHNLRIQNFVTKYVIFCELWGKMSVPDITNLGLASQQTATENNLKLLTSDISQLNSKFQFLRTEQQEVAKRVKNLVIRRVPV